MGIRAGLTAGVAILALAGCTVGPDFKAPDVFAPGSFFAWPSRAKPAPAPQAASIPAPEPLDVQWWRSFNDPELTALEARVATDNLDIRVAALRIEEARAQRAVAGGAEYPNVNANASYTRERASPNGIFSALGGSGANTGANGASAGTVANGSNVGAGGIPGKDIKPFGLWQGGFDATWELDLWGHVRRQVEAADAAIEVSAEARRAAMLSVVAEVARDYIQLRGVQRSLAITQENLKNAQQNLGLVRARAAGGVSTELDVANAQSQVASIEAQLPTLEQQQAEMINALSLLLGETPGGLQAQLITPQPVPPVPPRVPLGLPSELARRRPDIRQAEAQLHEATATTGVAVASFYPSITLSGSLSLQALQLSNLPTWASRQYALGPGITLPIFEGGQLKATLELRQQQQQEAAISYQKTVLQAWHDVDNALTAYQAEQRRRAALELTVRAARQALGLARQRYSEGFSDFIEVLTAQATLLQAEQQYATSTATVATNLVALYKALGGGWETAFPE